MKYVQFSQTVENGYILIYIYIYRPVSSLNWYFTHFSLFSFSSQLPFSFHHWRILFSTAIKSTALFLLGYIAIFAAVSHKTFPQFFLLWFSFFPVTPPSKGRRMNGRCRDNNKDNIYLSA